MDTWGAFRDFRGIGAHIDLHKDGSRMKSPLLADLSHVRKGSSPKAWLAGDAVLIAPVSIPSLLTGNFTGKYAISELSDAVSCPETAAR
jgi:hypothetical protein